MSRQNIQLQNIMVSKWKAVSEQTGTEQLVQPSDSDDNAVNQSSGNEADTGSDSDLVYSELERYSEAYFGCWLDTAANAFGWVFMQET